MFAAYLHFGFNFKRSRAHDVRVVWGRGGEDAETHDVLKGDGVVCKGMATFLELIGTWHMEDTEVWQTVDAVIQPRKRSECSEDARRLLRSTTLRYAAGALRRYELPFFHVEQPLHRTTLRVPNREHRVGDR